jgi:hypothetical protein
MKTKQAIAPRRISNYLQLALQARLRQFQSINSALLRCANISAITPVPVPISKMLNGLLSTSKRQQNAISTNFHGAAILFNRKLFKLNLDMKTKN